MPRRQRRPSYADVMSTIAVIFAVGTGGAYAASTLITGKQIAKNTVTTKNIKDGTVATADLAPAAISSLHGATGPAGAAGPTGAAGATGATGAPGPKGDRGVSNWDTIPSGQTITGQFYDQGHNDGAGTPFNVITFNLPGRAPTPLSDATVNFAPDSDANTTDDDPTCTGSVDVPTAPAGKVCIYRDNEHGLTAIDGETFSRASAQDRAFYISSKLVANADWDWYGAWAYTAP